MAERAEHQRRVGIHLGTAGGVFKAAERAQQIGANTFQIFSSSPRMWRASLPAPEVCARMKDLRLRHDLFPLVIHASYLVNVCSQTAAVLENSVQALRGEVERALALGAEYLVLHPGSWKGLTRQEGLRLAAESISRSLDGLPWMDSGLTILIENTAGAEFSLGSSLDQVAELIKRLEGCTRVAACLDTCHIHVSGYDIVSPEGYEDTVAQIERVLGLETVRVWHSNDAKAARGSRLDRHEHIGEGTIGIAPFRRLLNDARFRHSAFIAETPVDDDDDDLRNLSVLRSLIARSAAASV
ncbi:MAG TPA: deoxyribonuclease IV [Acidobacteriaceae bacterium]|nr:deoxyribonuclease IV [Acidobacteriaceae bacterium]